MMSGKRNKYTLQFKLAVISFFHLLKTLTILLDENMELIKSLSGTGEKQFLDYWKCQKKCADRGKTANHPEIEKALADWVQESRQDGYIVTGGVISVKALKLAKQTGIRDLKASACWCTRFMKRHDFVLRQKTKIAQRLPRELDDKITSFETFVIRRRQANEYALACM